MADQNAIPRPQAVGVFPLPAGYLLIDDGDGHAAVRAALVEGRRPAFPPSLRYYELALGGDLPEALAALDERGDVISLANRFVLAPSPELLDELGRRATGDVLAHVEMVAFTVGLRPEPPLPGRTDGELAAMAHVAWATFELERHDRSVALDHLEAAAQLAKPVSRALVGQILGQLANIQLDEGGKQRATVTFQAAIDALTGTDLVTNLADLHVTCGAMYQEMSEAAPRLMKAAIDHYMAALALVDAGSAPETFAIANANLGLAYLTTPMHEATDLLRIGIAVQSMREALKVFSAETHPERWSSTQVNLANALVYMPSTHQADNIAEAVELYEDVLTVRDRHHDPQGRARVLANQGNALAHLGIFDQAKARLHEARAIFEEFAEDDAVRSVRSILDEIARQESILRQDAAEGVAP
jgi:tetratricopeptide (TPR) repeat protein